MKLIRFGPFGQEKPGIEIDGVRKDVSAHFSDYDHAFFSHDGLHKLEDVIKNHELPDVSENERWGAPIKRPGKVVCIGLNYSDHAKESGMAIPEEPIVFLKGSNTVVGPFDDVQIPRNSKKTDWEVELGIVIGKDACYLDSEAEAEDCIAGYAVSHDVSEREFQLERGGQWVKGKSCNTFNPIGPYLVTKDEVPDVNDLKMKLHVNGEQMQNGSSSTMIFNCNFIVHYLSQFMTLEAGDFVTTGTPPGIGGGMKPPQFLKKGDVVELYIDHLGSQKQQVKAWDERSD
jgi:2,4-diketo-3-deoxy-L-fuconate hydrolase